MVLYNRNDVEQIQLKSRAKPSENIKNAPAVEESTSASPTVGTSEGENDHAKEATEPEAA